MNTTANLRMNALDKLSAADEPEFILMIDVTDISPDPNQPRKEFDEEKIEGMARSFVEHGQIDPIEVRLNPDMSGTTWLLISGENRLRAAKRAKFEQLRAIERKDQEDPKRRRARQFASNVHRSEMTASDQARYLQDVKEEVGSVEGVAERTGMSISQVSKLLSVLNLSGVALDVSESGLSNDLEVLTQIQTLEKQSPAEAAALVEAAKSGGPKLNRQNVREKTKEVKQAKKGSGKDETKGKGKGAGIAPANKSFGGGSWEAPRAADDGQEYGSVRLENDGPQSRSKAKSAPMPIVFLEYIGSDVEEQALWNVMQKHGKASLCMIAGTDVPGCVLVQFGDSGTTEPLSREGLRIASVEYPV